MIVVDTSVWIGLLRGSDNAPVAMLRDMQAVEDILIGDLILLELLQGARDDRHAAAIEQNLRRFPILPMLDDTLAVAAARNYRLLRARGVTIRKTADMIIGTFCIERGYELLHADRDFAPMVEHLGLRLVSGLS